MARKKGNIPFLLVILGMALVGLLMWKQGGQIEGENDRFPLPSFLEEKDSTDTTSTEPSPPEQAPPADTVAPFPSISPADTLPAPSDTVALTDTVAKPTADAPSEQTGNYHVLEVLKKEGKLIYRINGAETENLVATIAEMDYSKPFVLKIAGNITYAEEKEVKDILDVKEIEYTEEPY